MRALLGVALLLAVGCEDTADTSSRQPGIGVPPPGPATQMPAAPTGTAGQGGATLPPSTMTPTQPPPTDGQAATPGDGMAMPMAPEAGTGGAADGTMGGDPMGEPATDPTMPPATGSGAPGTLTVEFSTISYGGEYAPQNYVAAWIEDAGGGFVKTLQRSAGAIHAGDLVGWTAASGGWGFSFLGGSTPDMTDAISTATVRSHQAHMITWNMQDGTGAVIPDGNYAVVLEMTESRARDRAGPTMRIDFVKGPQAQTVEPPGDAAFEGVFVHYEP